MTSAVSLSSLPTWGEEVGIDRRLGEIRPSVSNLMAKKSIPLGPTGLAGSVYLYSGDITKLSVDAIVNAANCRMLGGGGVDGAIHKAAGRRLREECERLPLIGANKRLAHGDALVTGAYRLPCRAVIHTVGPEDRRRETLVSSYRRCLEVARDSGLRSVAFCCISTGVYGYSNLEAAIVALQTVQQFILEGVAGGWSPRVIFTVFLPVDRKIYTALLPFFFPVDPPPTVLQVPPEGGAGSGEGSSGDGEGGGGEGAEKGRDEGGEREKEGGDEGAEKGKDERGEREKEGGAEGGVKEEGGEKEEEGGKKEEEEGEKEGNGSSA